MNNTNYVSEELTTKPTVVEATCSGSEIWLSAWARGEKVTVRKGATTKATFVVMSLPRGAKDGVHEKLVCKFRGDDIAELGELLKKVTLYSTVKVRGVTTLQRKVYTQTEAGRELHGVDLEIRHPKFEVTPPADKALLEFDGPVAQVEQLPYEAKDKAATLVGSAG